MTFMITQVLVSVTPSRRFPSIPVLASLLWVVANLGLANGSQTSLHTCLERVLDHVNYEHEDSLEVAVSRRESTLPTVQGENARSFMPSCS